MIFTILGGRGFIGGALKAYLGNKGHDVRLMEPGEAIASQDNLGHLLYCIGLTADFRTRIPDTLEAHVCLLKRIVDQCSFDSFVYFSSTRVYAGSDDTAESATLCADPHSMSDFYNLTKLMGEAYCLQCGKAGMKIVRLSNVIGSDPESENFVNSLVREAAETGAVDLRSHPESEKDFILLEDVLGLAEKIAVNGKQSVYNIASGKNITFQSVADAVCMAGNAELKTDFTLPKHCFKPINIDRIKSEFGFEAQDILPRIKPLIDQMKS